MLQQPTGNIVTPHLNPQMARPVIFVGQQMSVVLSDGRHLLADTKCPPTNVGRVTCSPPTFVGRHLSTDKCWPTNVGRLSLPYRFGRFAVECLC